MRTESAARLRRNSSLCELHPARTSSQNESKLSFTAFHTEKNPDNASIILKKIEMTMGHRMKLSEFTEDQCDLMYLVVLDMRDML